MVRKPEGMNINRISFFSHNAVKKYFNSLVSVIEKHKHFQSKIVNVHET